MISPISNASRPQPVAQSTQTNAKNPVQGKPHSASSGDTVTLSNTAQAMAAALAETQETSTQTSQEAHHGDLQAQRLLAKEAAAKPVAK
jgi:hypothetical protein